MIDFDEISKDMEICPKCGKKKYHIVDGTWSGTDYKCDSCGYQYYEDSGFDMESYIDERQEGIDRST